MSSGQEFLAGVVADWYIKIYNSFYAPNNDYGTLKLYSNAIGDTFEHNQTAYKMYLIVRAIAFGILTVYFLINLSEKVSEDNFSTPQLFSSLLKYVVGYMIAIVSFDAVKGIFFLGDSLIDLLKSTSTVSPIPPFYKYPLEYSLVKAGNADGSFSLLWYLFKAVLPLILCLLYDIVLIYMILSRIIKICVSAAMSPIAVADVFDSVKHSEGIKFFKKIFAMSLQCCMILVISVLMTNITNYMVQDLSDTRTALTQNATDAAQKITDARNYKIKDKFLGNVFSSKERKEVIKKYTTKKKVNDANAFKKIAETYADDKAPALLKSFYTEDYSIPINFLNAVIPASATAYFTLIAMMAIKMALIRKSNALCNTILGV